ncbi:hypothetical protein BJX96DRAFT_123474 [Aspergillus floccosus]
MERQVQFDIPLPCPLARPQVRALQYANLNSSDSFPKFINLPKEPSNEFRYYDQIKGLPPTPRKHWCLLFELEAAIFSDRLVFKGHDATGYCFHVEFYTDDAGRTFLEGNDVALGDTLAIMYPVRRGSRIAIEDDRMIKVFPTTLENLFRLNNDIQTWPREFAKHPFCHTCKTEHRQLEVCRCGIVAYCSRECEAFDLRQGKHGYDCGLLQDYDFLELMSMRWHLFNDYRRFPLDRC